MNVCDRCQMGKETTSIRGSVMLDHRVSSMSHEFYQVVCDECYKQFYNLFNQWYNDTDMRNCVKYLHYHK